MGVTNISPRGRRGCVTLYHTQSDLLVREFVTAISAMRRTKYIVYKNQYMPNYSTLVILVRNDNMVYADVRFCK